MAQNQPNHALLAMIRTKHPDYHPIMAIADLAHETDSDAELRFRCHATILKYVEPELKSIEVKGAVGDEPVLRISLFEPVTIDGETGIIESKGQQSLGNW